MKQTLITFAVAAVLRLRGQRRRGAAEQGRVQGAEGPRSRPTTRPPRTAAGPLKGNAQDICKAEAKGKQKSPRLNSRPSRTRARAQRNKVKTERPTPTYKIAKEKCDDLSGNAKDVCKKDAKAAFETAKADAKVSSARSDAAGEALSRAIG